MHSSNISQGFYISAAVLNISTDTQHLHRFFKLSVTFAASVFSQGLVVAWTAWRESPEKSSFHHPVGSSSWCYQKKNSLELLVQRLLLKMSDWRCCSSLVCAEKIHLNAAWLTLSGEECSSSRCWQPQWSQRKRRRKKNHYNVYSFGRKL